MMTQKDRILQYLQDNGSITPMDAVRMGIMRLAPRIMELRIDGFQITSELVDGKNEYGRYHYAKYTLEG